MMPKVSVIVPAYNAEKFLQRCLDSLAAQTLQEMEVVVVNDGSTDATGRIADCFAEKDHRFRVVHQTNSGVAVARQVGLDACTGEFTIHVDSDDWIDPEMLARLYARAEAEISDMVICDFTVHFAEGKTEIWRQDPGRLDHWNVFGKTLHDLYGSLCNKLIRKSCYAEAGVRIDGNLFACEDQLAVLSLLTRPLRISYLGEALYHYDRTQNDSSYVNANPLIKERLTVLERMDAAYDLSQVRSYYDKAIAHLAYEALYLPKEKCPDYSALFKKHGRSIRHAEGFPFYVKALVMLRIAGVNLPVASIKNRLHRSGSIL